MEKNCLLTTYKATVDNPELKVLGELVMKFKNVEADNDLIALQNNPVFEYVKIDKNVKSSQLGTILPAGNLQPGTYENGIKSIEAGDYTLRIKSKYEVDYLFGLCPIEMDLNDLQFKETMQSLRGIFTHTGNQNIKLSNIKYVNIKCDTEIPITELIKSNTISCSGNCVKGNLEDVKNFLPNLTEVHFEGSRELYGDFKWLGLTKTNDFKNCVVNTQITGNVEDFVAVRRANGQTSGEVTFKWLSDGGRVKFNGVPIGINPTSNISWDATTITHNEETITA